MGSSVSIEGGHFFEQSTASSTAYVSDELARLLLELGITHAFGLIGGACAPLASALGKSELRVVHARHEAGAVFQALEASLATGRPMAAFATTGPGLLNALNGIAAARYDGGRVLLLSGATTPSQHNQ